MMIMSVVNDDLSFAVLILIQQILCIFIYIELRNINKTSFDKCATVYKGWVNLKKILQTEMTEKHIKRVHKTQEKKEKMLVMSKNSCQIEIILSSHSF